MTRVTSANRHFRFGIDVAAENENETVAHGNVTERKSPIFLLCFALETVHSSSIATPRHFPVNFIIVNRRHNKIFDRFASIIICKNVEISDWRHRDRRSVEEIQITSAYHSWSLKPLLGPFWTVPLRIGPIWSELFLVAYWNHTLLNQISAKILHKLLTWTSASETVPAKNPGAMRSIGIIPSREQLTWWWPLQWLSNQSVFSSTRVPLPRSEWINKAFTFWILQFVTPFSMILFFIKGKL